MAQDRFGKYRIESLIARGGMAEVYRASVVEGPGFERPVCLKMVRSELADEEEFVSMFEREARIAMALRHPNIVQVFDFERSEGRSFLVMEYVEGLDLREILRTASELGLRVPTEFALHAAAGLFAALSHAHGHTIDGEPRPIVHRDVSPHNLLVSTAGRVALADFGIAKARGGSNATRTGVVKGKLAYLSPEQAASGEIGAPSDLFCAGLVLYEALTGRRLYSGGNEQEVLAQALRPRVPELPSHAPELGRFLARLLAAEPADRFPCAEAAIEALASLRAAAPYSDGEAAELVRALIACRAERGIASVSTKGRLSSDRIGIGPPDAGGAGEVAEGPTRTSRSNIRAGRSGSGRVAGIDTRVAVAVAIGVLAGGMALGWFINGAGARKEGRGPEGTGSLGAAGDAVPPQPPAESGGGPRVVELPAPDAGAAESGFAENAKSTPEAQGAPAEGDRTAKIHGWIEVNCRPWAEVVVDGRRIGTTPIAKLRLAAGTHAVTLRNDAAGYREQVTVKIAPGETVHVNRSIPSAATRKGKHP